jgi:hypothetical protein
MFRALSVIPKSTNVRQLARFNKPIQFTRASHNSSFNVWTVLYLMETMEHEKSRSKHIAHTIEDRNIGAFDECLRENMYSNKYYDNMVDKTTNEMKHAELSLKSTIKNPGGLVLGVVINAFGFCMCDNWSEVVATLAASAPFYMYSTWKYPKECDLANCKYMHDRLVKKIDENNNERKDENRRH